MRLERPAGRDKRKIKNLFSAEYGQSKAEAISIVSAYLFFPDGRGTAGHHAAGGGHRQADLVAAGLAAKAGHQGGLEHIFHDRRRQAGGVAVDRKEQRGVAEHLFALADEVVDCLLYTSRSATRS